MIKQGLPENDDKGSAKKRSEAENSRQSIQLEQESSGETSIEERKKAGETVGTVLKWVSRRR